MSRANYTLAAGPDNYLAKGSDEYKGAQALINGETLNVGTLAGKRLLKAGIVGLRKITDGFVRDAGISNLTIVYPKV